MDKLYATLKQRRRPEDVAQMILETVGERLTAAERTTLERAARGSLLRSLHAYTSMAQEFARPVGAARQVGKAQELFAGAYPLAPEQCDDPDLVEAFVHHVGTEIRKGYGASDFKADRMNRERRAAAGLDHSKRRYNKLFRHHARMEAKIHKMTAEWRKRDYFLIAKSALASRLPWEEFVRDEASACFVAYYTARANLRSEFTIAGQQRPYDEIADMLFSRVRASETANWYAVAHVYPNPEVFFHLSDAQKGELLGRWYSLLREIAGLLEEVWDRSDIARDTMIVRRGNDSSTWNQTAGAWNKARDHWIGLVYSLGMERMLGAVCPGKALRLMAADVAAWHRSAGGGLDPNTLVWRELPLPWEVLLGDAECTLATIEAVCAKHGIDPVKTGWVAPRPHDTVAQFRPTPELVHGVTVSSPHLAALLRRAGVFSGKEFKPEKLFGG